MKMSEISAMLAGATRLRLAVQAAPAKPFRFADHIGWPAWDRDVVAGRKPDGDLRILVSIRGSGWQLNAMDTPSGQWKGLWFPFGSEGRLREEIRRRYPVLPPPPPPPPEPVPLCCGGVPVRYGESCAACGERMSRE